MKQNVGPTDKIVRALVAVVFLYLGYVYSPWLWLVTLWGAVTAGLGYCLLYDLLGVSTCGSKPSAPAAPAKVAKKKGGKK